MRSSQVADGFARNSVPSDLAHKASCVLNLLGSTLHKATGDDDDTTWKNDGKWIEACNLVL